jgi:hypothetical protein
MAPDAKAERWKRLEAAFHAALETPESERGELVRHLCEGDNTLLVALEDLLAALKELVPRCFPFNGLRGCYFFHRHKFVASLMRLAFEFRFKTSLPFNITLSPNRSVVLDLPLHHRVEDDRYLMGGCRGGCRRIHFAFHPAQIIPQRRRVVM